MDNLEEWEEIRIIAYILISIGAVFFLVGVYFEAASFGLDASSTSVVSLISGVIKDTGTACGTLGGALGFIAEGMK